MSEGRRTSIGKSWAMTKSEVERFYREYTQHIYVEEWPREKVIQAIKDLPKLSCGDPVLKGHWCGLEGVSQLCIFDEDRQELNVYDESGWRTIESSEDISKENAAIHESSCAYLVQLEWSINNFDITKADFDSPTEP